MHQHTKALILVHHCQIAVSPDEADPYYWIGKTYEAMGKKEDARNNYQSALNLDKDMAEAREGLDRVK